MNKIDKSNGASAAFSSKALDLASAKKASGAPQKGSTDPAMGQWATEGTAAKKGGVEPSTWAKKAVNPLSEPSAAREFDTLAAESAQQARAMAGAPNTMLDLSAESRALSGLAEPAARTVDAGAPAGSGKRLKAYGQAQQALAPKGGGFDGSA